MPLNIRLQLPGHQVSLETLNTRNNDIQWWLMTYNFLSITAKIVFGNPVVTLKPIVCGVCITCVQSRKKSKLSDQHIPYPAWNCWSLKTGKVNVQHIPYPYWKSGSLKEQKLNDQDIPYITWKLRCDQPGDLKTLSKIVPFTWSIHCGNFLLL